MSRIMIGCAMFTSLLLLSGTAAVACSDLPNICAAHQQHHQNMQDIAATPPQYQEDEYYEEDSYANDYASYPDPTQEQLDEIARVVAAAQQQFQEVGHQQEKQQALMSDPRYQRYLNGGWEYFQDKAGRPAAPGEFCAALYWKKDGMVRLSGPGGSFNGAMMTFWGENIPKPSGVERVQVTLSQSDGSPPQTVEALNYYLPNDGYGAIAFLVPSMDALLDNILDVHGFDLAMNGQSVAKVDWTGGFAARDQLRSCYSQRR